MGLTLDFETRSVVNLKTRGAYVYVEHPSTDALIASYLFEGNLYRWRRGEPFPERLSSYIESGGEVRAHNAAFERLVWQKIMTPRHNWPAISTRQFRCTAVTAAAMSLPRDLEALGDALGLKIKKDKRGKDLMKIHSIPRGFDERGAPIWHPLADDPASMEQYHGYCDFDVLSENEADGRLVPLSDAEMEVYWLNEEINDRGLRIDGVSAAAALELIERAKRQLDEELAALTSGHVTAVTQVARLQRWLAAQGVALPTLDKDQVDETLHLEDLPERVRRALELRQEGAKPSVDKIAAMAQRCSADGRARGVYLDHGAGQTGRFSSRGVQAHNMPKYREIFEKAHVDTDVLFEAIRTGLPEALTALYGSEIGRPLHLLSDAVRSFIWAAPGKEYIVADYSAIEGRMAAWFAGEFWKLEAFRAIDRGEGHGIYELNAAGMYRVPVENITKPQRQSGKIAELALGYQGGCGALAKMARQQRIKLAPIFEGLWASASWKTREDAERRYEERLKKHDATLERIGREAWMAAHLIKVGWRERHPAIVAAWKSLEEAAWRAVEEPGTVVRPNGVLGVAFVARHGFLWLQLPSGRCLAYGAPKIRETEAPWADPTEPEHKRERKLSLTVRGVDPQTEKCVRYPIYGGSLFNNVVQGSARDILVHGMFAAERAGFNIVLHTHDEIGCEEDRGTRTPQELEQVISRLPAWAAGLPLTAQGFASKRYRKA